MQAGSHRRDSRGSSLGTLSVFQLGGACGKRPARSCNSKGHLDDSRSLLHSHPCTRLVLLDLPLLMATRASLSCHQVSTCGCVCGPFSRWAHHAHLSPRTTRAQEIQDAPHDCVSRNWLRDERARISPRASIIPRGEHLLPSSLVLSTDPFCSPDRLLLPTRAHGSTFFVDSPRLLPMGMVSFRNAGWCDRRLKSDNHERARSLYTIKERVFVLALCGSLSAPRAPEVSNNVSRKSYQANGQERRWRSKS
jgi:hypothetical protein